MLEHTKRQVHKWKFLQHALSRYVYNRSFFDIFTSKKVFCCLRLSSAEKLRYNKAIEHFFRVHILASSKHEEGRENSRQLRKQETSSIICLTFENSLSPSNAVYRPTPFFLRYIEEGLLLSTIKQISSAEKHRCSENAECGVSTKIKKK